MTGNSEQTAKPKRKRGEGKPFEKGKSGNPSGRPKQTQEQKDALEAIRQLAPKAVEQLEHLINDIDTPTAAKIKAIEIVLDRTYGRPDMSVKVDTPKANSLNDIKAEMERLKGGGNA